MWPTIDNKYYALPAITQYVIAVFAAVNTSTLFVTNTLAKIPML